MTRVAVVLMNLGGPDSQDAVQPFLFNLFNDPAIISLPMLVRWPLARFISARRAPIARKSIVRWAVDRRWFRTRKRKPRRLRTPCGAVWTRLGSATGKSS